MIDFKEIEKFWEFAKERQRIWVKKEQEKLPPPWTEDPLLKEYKFTNIWRQDDRFTRYMAEHLSALSGWGDVLLASLAGRMICNIDTIEKTGLPRIHSAKAWINNTRRTQDWKWGDAYMVLAPIPPGSDKRHYMLKIINSVADKIRKEINRKKADETYVAPSDWIFNTLKDQMYIGEFMAYEVLLDFWQWKGVPEGFCVVGGGAKGALQRMFPDQAIGDHLILYLMETVPEELKEHPLHGKITMRCIEGLCCEYRKYVNLRDNPNSRKRKYHYEDRV